MNENSGFRAAIFLPNCLLNKKANDLKLSVSDDFYFKSGLLVNLSEKVHELFGTIDSHPVDSGDDVTSSQPVHMDLFSREERYNLEAKKSSIVSKWNHRNPLQKSTWTFRLRG